MNDEQAAELIRLQQEANRWLRILVLPALATSLSDALKTPDEWRVYKASNGGTSREVGRAAGVSHPTVLRYWNRWAKLGLVEPVAAGRYSRIVSPDEVGIVAPE